MNSYVRMGIKCCRMLNYNLYQIKNNKKKLIFNLFITRIIINKYEQKYYNK